MTETTRRTKTAPTERDDKQETQEGSRIIGPRPLQDRRRLSVSPSVEVTNGLPPEPPEGLSDRGQALWRNLTGAYELGAHESALLHEACRTVDLLDVLQAAIDADGPLLPWGDGVRASPAAVEARQHRIALARLFGALAVPDEDESAGRRFRRRRGVA